MNQMTRKTRLSLTGLLLLVSAFYAALISQDPDFANAVMVGYIALVLTIFVVNEMWKR